MFEDDVVTTASNDLIDGSIATDALEPSPSHSPAAPANGHAQARMQEINQLINDLEAATQATNANVTILRGKLTVSQQQLELKSSELKGLQEEAARHQQQWEATESELVAVRASKERLEADYGTSQQQLEEKKDELVDLREEAERSLQQLQVTQAQLEENVLSLKEAKEENELLLLQLHQVQEELEVIFLEGQDKDTKLKEQGDKLNWNQKKLKEARDKNEELLVKLAKLTDWADDIKAKLEWNRKARVNLEHRREELVADNTSLLAELHASQSLLEDSIQSKDDLASKLDIAGKDLNKLNTYLSLQANIFIQHRNCAMAGYSASKQSLPNKILRKIISLTYSS